MLLCVPAPLGHPVGQVDPQIQEALALPYALLLQAVLVLHLALGVPGEFCCYKLTRGMWSIPACLSLLDYLVLLLHPTSHRSAMPRQGASIYSPSHQALGPVELEVECSLGNKTTNKSSCQPCVVWVLLFY